MNELRTRLVAWPQVVGAALLLLAMLEGGLALIGVQPRIQQEDPFVGFSSSIPLFTEGLDSSGQPVMMTSSNKRGFFNHQTFTRDKPPGTLRVFCLGGSTTYGRPFSDETAFSGWPQS